MRDMCVHVCDMYPCVCNVCVYVSFYFYYIYLLFDVGAVWKSEDNLKGIVLLFYHVLRIEGTQVLRIAPGHPL